MKIISRLLLAFTIVFMLDILTKTWAEQALSFQRPVSVIGDLFRFTLGYNTGVAFGLFAKGGSGPLILTGIVIIGLAIWAISALRSGDFTSAAVWPMGLILGGAVGNFGDRLLDLRVTDFLDVGIGATRWPTFNLADSFIILGIVILLLTTLSARPGLETKP